MLYLTDATIQLAVQDVYSGNSGTLTHSVYAHSLKQSRAAGGHVCQPCVAPTSEFGHGQSELAAEEAETLKTQGSTGSECVL